MYSVCLLLCIMIIEDDKEEESVLIVQTLHSKTKIFRTLTIIEEIEEVNQTEAYKKYSILF